ncbi:MAG TPA: hypothetical protein VHC43_03310 [Mycobacteriales bacterium]|nr:hypothetical protein [Mycobacteriales bacterium]
MTERLVEGMSGRWAVRTASGAEYVVDLDARTVRRHCVGAKPAPGHALVGLRRDREPVMLVAVEHIEIGRPARLVLRGVASDQATVTCRVTTPVVTIEPADGEADDDWCQSTHGARTPLAELLADPTRCYAAGCPAENEILVHLGPDAFADLCLDHARATVARSAFVLTCDCSFCRRARADLLGL